MIQIRPDHANKKAFASIAGATDQTRTGLRTGLTEIGRENSLHMSRMIRTGKRSGRLYRIKGRLHRASAPGEPPATLTGALANSVGFRVYGWERMEFGDRVPYGVFLEDGTRRMAARPHVKRTVDEKSRDNFNTLCIEVDREVKR